MSSFIALAREISEFDTDTPVLEERKISDSYFVGAGLINNKVSVKIVTYDELRYIPVPDDDYI